MVLQRMYRVKWVVISAFLTLFGLCEIGCAILWVEWRTIEFSNSPLVEIEGFSVSVDGVQQPLNHSIFVHRGDALNITRIVKSSETVNAEIERVFNTGDPDKTIDLPIISQKFFPGLTVMAPGVVVVPQNALLWQLYRFETVAFDFYHAPKVFNDFSICVVPADVKPPAERMPCVAPGAGGDMK